MKSIDRSRPLCTRNDTAPIHLRHFQSRLQKTNGRWTVDVPFKAEQNMTTQSLMAQPDSSGDALVRRLLGDFRNLLFFLLPDLGFPMQMTLIRLMEFLHPFHEPVKFLKLRPLVVRGPHRHIDFTEFLNGQLACLLCGGVSGCMDL